MLKRFDDIKEFLVDLDSDLTKLLLSPREIQSVQLLCSSLESFESISKALQRESLTLSEARALFDALLENFPSFDKRLGDDADIIIDKTFESAVVKIDAGNISTLSASEKKAVRHLENKDHISKNSVVENDLNEDYADQIIKRFKSSSKVMEKSYLPLSFIRPTSNICEREFSIAGYCLSDRRMSLEPEFLEIQLFLHANHDLWDSKFFVDAIIYFSKIKYCNILIV
jgi:hypothetical protein